MIRVPAILKPKRRWLQFRMRTMLCMIALIAVVCGWPHIRRHYAFRQLREYAGIDLRELPDDEKRRVNRWIEVATGCPTDEPFYLFRENWLVHVSSSPEGAQRMYVVQMEPTMSIPGTSYCQLHLFDGWGRPIQQFHFNVGYRTWPDAAKFDESSHGFLCLIVDTTGMWSGETRQFYRITDKHVEMLRSEGPDGNMATSNGNGFEVADKPADWSDWESLVASDDPVDQLRGLAAFWLWGTQQNLEPIDEATRRHLERLSKSKDRWISESSAAALKLPALRRQNPAATDAPRLD